MMEKTSGAHFGGEYFARICELAGVATVEPKLVSMTAMASGGRISQGCARRAAAVRPTAISPQPIWLTLSAPQRRIAPPHPAMASLPPPHLAPTSLQPPHPAMPSLQPPHPAMAADRVNYVGEPVALVVAETLAAARNAAELVDVSYEELEAVVLLADAAALPDIHPEAPHAQADIDWLKAKLDAGADEALTQFFFEAETFLRFRDACAKAGIDKPIVPGILPIENWAGAKKFAKRCGAQVPDWVDQAFDKAIRDNRHDLLATALCTELCSDLIDEGVDKLHFYTLNRPELTRDVCFALGITPKADLQNVA